MSGIVGVFNRNGEPVSRETIISMCDAIKHRGPDGRGIWTDGSVGLGHVLLHTTKESLREEQPLSFDGKTWITADARIDDRDGLINLLKSRVGNRESLKQATDVELLLHAYHTWGVECVDNIIGVFGAAIWDGRAQRLVCLRDHIGIKPFYYAETFDRLIIASEIKGILASGLVPQRIYEPRIADFLVDQLEGVDKTCTFFEGVLKLPPAHCMVLSRNHSQKDEYWLLEPNEELRFEDQSDYMEAFREKFFEAVNCRLRGAEPVVSMLSGGLDSSSIVAASREILSSGGRADLQTYSLIDSENTSCEETLHINHMLAQGGFKASCIDIREISKYLEHLIQLPTTSDDLFDVFMSVPQILYLETNKNGGKVILDGMDGDLVLGQPGNHIAYLLQQYQITKAIHEAKCFRHFYWQSSDTTLTYLYQAARSAYMPMFLRSVRQRMRMNKSDNLLKKSIENSVINKKFAHKINLLDRLETLWSYDRNDNFIDLQQSHARALRHPYLVVAIERYERLASKHSLEPRHPLLDKRLIEFCLALPWNKKVCEGWTKILMRHCMEGLLPSPVAWRRGRSHLGRQVTLKLLIEEVIPNWDANLAKIKKNSQYLDLKKVNQAYQVCKSSRSSTGLDKAAVLLQAYALASWMENFN